MVQDMISRAADGLIEAYEKHSGSIIALSVDDYIKIRKCAARELALSCRGSDMGGGRAVGPCPSPSDHGPAGNGEDIPIPSLPVMPQAREAEPPRQDERLPAAQDTLAVPDYVNDGDGPSEMEILRGIKDDWN